MIERHFTHKEANATAVPDLYSARGGMDVIGGKYELLFEARSPKWPRLESLRALSESFISG
jgi:hypothetical protein